MITFEVLGVAIPKGSAQAFVPKKWADDAYKAGRAPRAIVTHDNAKTKGWQQLVAEQAQHASPREFFTGPVSLSVTFRLSRPKHLAARIRHHVTLPDLDKLVRSIGDALAGVLYDDDKQIVELHARKVYAAHGTAPSATITLEHASPPAPVGPTLFDSESEEPHGEEGSSEDTHRHRPAPRPPAKERRPPRHGGPRDQAARGRRGAVRRDSR